MGNRVLVASGESGVTVPAGSVVTFPESGNVWNNNDLSRLSDAKVLASLSASSGYLMRLVTEFDDPDTGSTFSGVVEQFSPSATLGDGAGKEVFRSDGVQDHFTQLEIENSSATDLTVGQLGVIWESST